MRFAARRAPERSEALAQGLGISDGTAEQRALGCAEAIATFIGGFSLPHRLRDFGVASDEARALADLVHHEIVCGGAFGLPIDPDQVTELLDACWQQALRLDAPADAR